MKESFRIFLKSFVISLMFCVVLVGVGYYYINDSLTPAQNEVPEVPYSQENPENAGILFEINNDKTFVYLDFEGEKLSVSVNPEEEADGQILGYSLDYKVKGNLKLLSYIIDYVGGIEMNEENIQLRFTGVQIAEILETTTDSSFKREILEKICEKISRNGVALDFFAGIIENSETNLNIPACYFWEEKMIAVCRNLQIID